MALNADVIVANMREIIIIYSLIALSLKLERILKIQHN